MAAAAATFGDPGTVVGVAPEADARIGDEDARDQPWSMPARLRRESTQAPDQTRRNMGTESHIEGVAATWPIDERQRGLSRSASRGADAGDVVVERRPSTPHPEQLAEVLREVHDEGGIVDHQGLVVGELEAYELVVGAQAHREAPPALSSASFTA